MMQPTNSSKSQQKGYREIIDELRKNFPVIKEVCLISNGFILMRNLDIDCEDEWYVRNVDHLINAGTFQLNNLSDKVSINRIFLKLEQFSLVVQVIRPASYIVVVYDNTDKDMDRQMPNAIGVYSSKLRNHLAY